MLSGSGERRRSCRQAVRRHEATGRSLVVVVGDRRLRGGAARLPLAALAAEGTRVPGLPRFRYGPLYGDANGYYAAAREVVAAASRVALPLLALALLGGGLLYGLVRRTASPVVSALVAAAVPAAAATVLVLEMRPAGAPVVAGPCCGHWARASPRRRPGLRADAAFVVGVGISLAAVTATVVAAAYVGLWASGGLSVGMLSASLSLLWPLVPGLVVGERAWENGSWFVDVGLHLYTEPLSSARRRRGGLAPASCRHRSDERDRRVPPRVRNGREALGRPHRGRADRRSARCRAPAAGCSRDRCRDVRAPLVVAYWDKGYVDLYDGNISVSDRTWSLDYVGPPGRTRCSSRRSSSCC